MYADAYLYIQVAQVSTLTFYHTHIFLVDPQKNPKSKPQSCLKILEASGFSRSSKPDEHKDPTCWFYGPRVCRILLFMWSFAVKVQIFK